MSYVRHIWQTKEIIRREYLQNIEDGIYNEEQRAIEAESQKVGKTDYATTTDAGVFKPDGTTVDVDENGVLSVIGGSGHKILDKDGTELEQRDNLQFDDAIITDDSVNNKTVVKSNIFEGTIEEWNRKLPSEQAQYKYVFLSDDYEPTDYRMVGATSTTDGRSGDVPTPRAGQENSFLRGDGTWQSVPVHNGLLTIKKNNTTVVMFSANQSSDVTANFDIPTKTSDLTNDSGFITSANIPTKTSDLTNDSGFITSSDIPAIPTKTSDLTNDSGFITSSDIPSIPTKTSDLTNDSGFITSSALPTKTSDLTNDSNFTVSTYMNATLAENATTVTFTGLDTSGNHLYDVYTDKPGLDYEAIEVPQAGQLKLTFEAQTSATNVYLKITDF